MDSTTIGSPEMTFDNGDSSGSDFLSSVIAATATNSARQEASATNTVTRLAARARRTPTPFPSDIVDNSATDHSTAQFQLAEVAANASAQLQHQINLMAQAIAIQMPTVTAATFPHFASSQQPLNSELDLALSVGLPNVLDQYISTATSQQHQHSSIPIVPATVSNLSAPFAAYLQAAQQQPAQQSGTVFIQQHQPHSSNNNVQLLARQASNSDSAQIYNSLLSAAAAAGICPCTVSPLTTVSTTFPQQQTEGNNNNNNARTTATLAENVQLTTGSNSESLPGAQQYPSVLVSARDAQQSEDGSLRRQPAVSTVTPLIHSNRLSRNSIKRPNGVSSLNTNEGRNNGTVAQSPLPQTVLIQPSAAPIHLSSRQNSSSNGFGEVGPSRGPKLRRLASFDEFTDDELQQHLPGQASATEIAAFHADPSSNITTAAATEAAAAAIVHLQQQAAAAVTLPSASTILSLSASAGAPFNPTTNNHQQRFIQQFQPASLLTTASALPPQSLVNDSNSAATAISALGGPAAAVASISAGVEQIMAVALNAANAANAALSPQTVAAMVAATGYPQTATTPQCAVCAAAACQSRMGTPMTAAVTACSCLHHHHHHHLHCHHNAIVSTQLPPVCSLCNSSVVGGSSSTAPSPSTTTMAQPRQNLLQSSSSTTQQPHHHQLQSNISCVVDGVPYVSSSSAGARMPVAAGSSLNQPNSSMAQIAQIAQRYLLNPSIIGTSDPNNNNVGVGNTVNNVSANVSIQANAAVGPSTVAAAAAAALSPSAVTAMLLNNVASATIPQSQPSIAQLAHPTHQPMSSLYSFQRNAPMSDFLTSHQQQQQSNSLNPMQQSLLASRLIQQERERDAANHFYQQQQQRAAALNAINAAATTSAPQAHLMRPLIMVPRLPAQVDLANVLLLHHPGSVGADAATLVLNGGANAASALAHATNPHHIVANAMATAAAPEPQPIGVSLDQIKKHSQKLSYVKDPDVPEQERDRCTVCLADFETDDELRALNCTHLFHTDCIDRWLQYNKKCPVCRVDMDKSGAGSSATTAEAAIMLNAYAAATAASATSSTPTC